MRAMRIVAPLALLALLAASCANHGDTNAAKGEDEGRAGGPAPSTASAKPGQFGTMKEPVCGPGSGGAASDKGVTADSIQIGVAGDAANTIVPDLDKEMYDASEAFVAWCNEAGGINGRKIEMTKRDGGLLKATEAVTAACAQDFALVGGGWALDKDTVGPRVACGLTAFPGFSVSPEARGAAKVVHSIPLYAEQMPITQYNQIAKAFPGSVANYGLMWTSSAMGTAGRPYPVRLLEAIGPAGYKLVYNEDLPPPVAPIDNWRPYVETMKNKGVKILDFEVTPEYLVPLLKTMRDVGWYPDAIVLPANFYNTSLLEAGNALKNTYINVYSEPFIGDSDSPAVKQFTEIMDKNAPEWKHAALAVNAFSAWLLFAKAAKDCGAQLTRACVEQKGLAVGTWDAGGLHAPGKPDTKSTPQPNLCGILMSATADGFAVDKEKTGANEGNFNCSTKNSVAVPL